MAYSRLLNLEFKRMEHGKHKSVLRIEDTRDLNRGTPGSASSSLIQEKISRRTKKKRKIERHGEKASQLGRLLLSKSVFCDTPVLCFLGR